MTSKLFEEWVRKLDRQFQLQGRSIALIIDHCSAHPPISDLRAIQLFFLPPNTTSLLQPWDQGIIKTFKTIYRKRVLRRFINSYEETETTNSRFKMSLLDALVVAAASWHDVEASTIQKCFQHASFVRFEPSLKTGSPTSNPVSVNSPLNEFTNLFERFSNIVRTTGLSVDEYISIDQSIATTEDLSLPEIAASLQQVSPEDEAEVEDDSALTPPVSSKCALKALEQVRACIMQQHDCNSALQQVEILENRILQTAEKSKRQILYI